MDYPNMSGLVSVSEAAEMIGRSKKRAYQLIRSGQLRAQRIDWMLVVPLEEVQKFQQAFDHRTSHKSLL